MVRRNREEDILEAAIKIFSDKGFNGATTSEIAKEAGVAEGTIFRYFKTKKDILRKVMIKLLEILGERFIVHRVGKILRENEGKDEKEILKAILKDRLQLVKEHIDLLQIVVTEIQYHEDLRKAFVESVVKKGKGVIEEFIKSGQERGIFRELDPAVVTRSLVGLFGAYILQQQLAPQLILIEEEQQIDMIIDIFFYGVANPNHK